MHLCETWHCHMRACVSFCSRPADLPRKAKQVLQSLWPIWLVAGQTKATPAPLRGSVGGCEGIRMVTLHQILMIPFPKLYVRTDILHPPSPLQAHGTANPPSTVFRVFVTLQPLITIHALRWCSGRGEPAIGHYPSGATTLCSTLRGWKS